MFPGRNFKIFFDGALVAAARTKSASLGREPIDETDGEDNGWQYFNPLPDTRQVSISVAGVSTPANWRLLDEMFSTESELPEFHIEYADGSVLAFEGAFIESLQYIGEDGDAVLFSAVFLLSGMPPEPAGAVFAVTVDGENPVIGYHPVGTEIGAIDPDPPLLDGETIDRIWASGSSFRVRFVGGASMPESITTISVETANYGSVVVDAQNPTSIVSGEYRWSATSTWEFEDMFIANGGVTREVIFA